MTEIPEHLRKRAEEARKKAAAAKAGGAETPPATVRNYLSNAISKVGARNRMDAIRIASDAGWL
jgi:hypothetical protein